MGDETINNAYQTAVDNAVNDYQVGNYNIIGKLAGSDAMAKNRQELLNARYQNEFNSAEATKSREWQEYMSNTANQRAAKDYEALGFSPMALLGGGSSASTPSGAVASGQKAGVHDSSGSQVAGALISALASIAVGSAAANARMAAASTHANAKIAVSNLKSGSLAGNSAQAVANNAKKLNTANLLHSAKNIKDSTETWESLLKELENIPKK